MPDRGSVERRVEVADGGGISKDQIVDLLMAKQLLAREDAPDCPPPLSITPIDLLGKEGVELSYTRQ